MVGHGGSSTGSYLANPTSPIPFHCASIVATSTLRVNIKKAVNREKERITEPVISSSNSISYQTQYHCHYHLLLLLHHHPQLRYHHPQQTMVLYNNKFKKNQRQRKLKWSRKKGCLLQQTSRLLGTSH